MLPALTAKNSRGRPNCRHGSHECQSGWLSMATRKPAASSTRCEDRHREAGVIDVGVAGDEDDVDGVPAARAHLGRRRRRERRGVALVPQRQRHTRNGRRRCGFHEGHYTRRRGFLPWKPADLETGERADYTKCMMAQRGEMHLSGHPPASAAALASLPEPLGHWFAGASASRRRRSALAWPALAAGRTPPPRRPDRHRQDAGRVPAGPRRFPISAMPAGVTLADGGLRALYVAPLKALGTDAARNLQTALDELAPLLPPGVRPPRSGVRTGDTPRPSTARLRHDPPDVLLTTPESLAVLLSQPLLQGLFGGLRWVVVDEVHALAADKRGADLALSLERLEGSSGAVAPRRPVRDGDAADGGGPLPGRGRPALRHRGSARQPAPLELRVAPLDDGADFLAAAGPSPRAGAAPTCATLIVSPTRARLAERLAWALRRRAAGLGRADRRASLGPGGRAAARGRGALQAGRAARGGQQHQPGAGHRHRRGRSGRAGPSARRRGAAAAARRPGGARAGAGAPRPGADGVRRRNCWRRPSPAASGRAAQCEPLRVPAAPARRAVPAAARHGAAAGTWSADEAFALVRRAYPYRDLVAHGFRRLPRLPARPATATADRWLPARLRRRRRQLRASATSRTARLLRRNLGTILAEDRAAVRSCASSRAACEEERAAGPRRGPRSARSIEAFADRLQPGDRFLLDGRCLEFRRGEGRRCWSRKSSAGRRRRAGAATAGRCPRSWPAGCSCCALQAAEALRDGPAALADLLRRDYGLGRRGGRPAGRLLPAAGVRQRDPRRRDAAGRGSRAVDRRGGLLSHTPLNRTGNDALARVAVASPGPRPRPGGRFRRRRPGLCPAACAATLADPPAQSLRTCSTADAFDADLDAALADGDALRQRFGRVAQTGLMLLRNPLGRRRRVGGRDWGERRLFDQVQARDPDFVLLRQAVREVRADCATRTRRGPTPRSCRAGRALPPAVAAVAVRGGLDASRRWADAATVETPDGGAAAAARAC